MVGTPISWLSISVDDRGWRQILRWFFRFANAITDHHGPLREWVRRDWQRLTESRHPRNTSQQAPRVRMKRLGQHRWGGSALDNFPIMQYRNALANGGHR